MAYVLKYKGEFKDHYERDGIVEIYQDGYTGSESEITINDIKIKYNYGGEFSPIISSSCSLNVINDRDDFNEYDEIVSNYEKEYKCVVKLTGTTEVYTIFEGFMVVDIISQQLYRNGSISLQFTDYLKRLKDTDPVFLTLIDKMTFLEIIQGILDLSGFDYPIVINSKLWNFGYKYPGDSTTHYTMTGVDTELFWKNTEERINGFEILEKILKSFSSYLYRWNGKWYIQRYDDIWDSTTWINYPHNSSTNTPVSSDWELLSVDDNDLHYVDRSQTLDYTSGLNELIIKLNNKTFDSLILNFWSGELTGTTSTYNCNPTLRNWLIHEDQIEPLSPYRGEKINYLSINRCYGIYSNDNWYYDKTGIYTTIRMTYNASGATILNLGWKVGCLETDRPFTEPGNQFKIYVPFFIKQKDTNNYLSYNETTKEYELNSGYVQLVSEYSEQDFELGTNVISHSFSVDLTSFGGSTPTDQDWVIGITSAGYDYVPDGWDDDDYSENWTYVYTYVGDFTASVNFELQNNTYFSTINENFLNKEEVELDIFDISSSNSKSGVYYGTNLSSRTESWTEDGTNYYTIPEHIIRSRWKYYNKTRKILNAQVITDNLIVPCSTGIEDSYIKDLDGNVVKLIVMGFSWNVKKCNYNIETQVASDDVIVLNYTN